MVHRPNVGIPHVSPHVVPKASLGGAAAVTPIAPADEEKTAVDSSWEDEQSTIDQAEMADKVRRALAEKRRAGSAGSTTATTGGHAVDEPTVEDRARPGIEAAAALGVARLLVESGPDAGKDFPLRAGKPVLVGRALDNSIVLTDLSVSRKHFEINWDGGHWALSDRGSGNGTLLNGKLEEGTFRLFAGDRIEIGHTIFRFEQTGQGQRNQWAEEEPSTIAGRRNSAVGSPRPSALQTSEFDVSPAASAAISMVERKPIPLTEPRNPPIDLHRRPTAAPSPNPYTAPGSASIAASSPVPSAAPGSPGLPPPSSPQFLGNNPRHAVRPLLGDIPGGTPFHNGGPAPGAPFSGGGLSAPGAPGLRSTALGNPPPGSAPMMGGQSSPVSGQNGPPSAPLGTPMMGGLAPRGAPMNTLTGRPPVVGPTAPPSMGDAMVPPRQISQSSIPLDMIPGMTTVPHPRSLVGPPMSRPTLSAQHERAIAPRMMSRSNDMIADSGVAVSPPRFPDSQPSEPRSLLADGVPRLNRPNKTTIALIGGGVVLLVAVVALAMSTGNDTPSTGPTTSGTATDPSTGATTSTANGTSVEPIEQPVKSAELLAAEKAAAEKAAAEKAAAEKTAAEQAAAEKLAAERLTAERLAAEKAATEKAAAEQAAAEKLAIEQAATEKAATEKAERLAAEKAAAEKAAAQKADKAAAAREARLAAEKAAAEKAAAQKAAKSKKDQPKRIEKDKERVAETAAPQPEVDSEAVLGKAEDLYRKKNFAAAAATIREAIRGRTAGTDELRATAQIYEALQRTYSAGTAVGAKPTEAYTNLRSASRYDDKLGSAHSSDINPRILALAPRAAAQFLALKQYEEAFQALRDAERAGASNSTLNAVRTAVDARANELYNEAQGKRADDPAAARSLYKKVLKLVESGSPLYQKATKGVSETT